MEQDRKIPPALGMEELIAGVSESVARAQFEMDMHSLETARRFQEEGVTDSLGFQARWYAIPEVDFQLKVMLQISEGGELKTEMVSGEYGSRYAVDTELVSDFNMKLRREPREPPNNPTLLSEGDVLERVSRLRRVAEILHAHPGSYLTVVFEPAVEGPGYSGGTWVAEVVRPPGVKVSTKKVTTTSTVSLRDAFPIRLDPTFVPLLDAGAGGKELRTFLRGHNVPFSSRSLIEPEVAGQSWNIHDKYYKRKFRVVLTGEGPVMNLVSSEVRAGLDLLAYLSVDDATGDITGARYLA